MEKKLIGLTHIQSRIPILGTIVAWLLLRELDAPGWAWGVLGSVVALSWMAWAYMLFAFKCVHPRDM